MRTGEFWEEERFSLQWSHRHRGIMIVIVKPLSTFNDGTELSVLTVFKAWPVHYLGYSHTEAVLLQLNSMLCNLIFSKGIY